MRNISFKGQTGNVERQTEASWSERSQPNSLPTKGYRMLLNCWRVWLYFSKLLLKLTLNLISFHYLNVYAIHIYRCAHADSKQHAISCLSEICRENINLPDRKIA